MKLNFLYQFTAASITPD